MKNRRDDGLSKMFRNENQMRDQLIEWLKNNGFVAEKSLHVKTFEVDIAGLAPVVVTRDGLEQAKRKYAYAFETKIATTYKLAREVVEQAIIRLLVADYVYVVVPKTAEVWKDDVTKEQIAPPEIVKRIALGTYSRSVGIIAMEPDGPIEFVRIARKSGLVINELKEYVVKELNKKGGIRPLY